VGVVVRCSRQPSAGGRGVGRVRGQTEWEKAMAVRLKGLRESKGMTQAALAEAAGVSLRTYQSWEQGVRTPLFDAVTRVAVARAGSWDVLAGIRVPPRGKKGRCPAGVRRGPARGIVAPVTTKEKQKGD